MDRRAPLRHGRVGTAGSSGAMAAIQDPVTGADERQRAQLAGDYRLHRHRSARRADHARAQRQRFLGLHIRRPAGRGGNSYLDRCRRCAVGRPAAGTRRPGDRLAVIQRGHGAGLFRRQSDSSSDHGAGGRTRHPDLDPQYLFAPQGRHADLRRAQVDAAGQGHYQHRERGAGESRGRGHDRRAGYGASSVRRVARGRRFP